MDIWNQTTKCVTTPAKLLWTVKEHAGPVETVAFSQDRKLLASGGRDGTGRLWDMTSSKPKALAVFRKPGDSFRSLAFSPNRQYLAAGSVNGTVSLFAVAMNVTQEIRVLRGARGSINSIAFSADGKQLAGGGDDLALRVWEPGATTGGDARILLPGHNQPIRDVAFAPNGICIATAGQDSSARIWAMGPVRPSQKMYLQHRSAVTAISYSPDGMCVATSQKDGFIWLWDITSSKPMVQAELSGHAGGTRLVLIASDGETLVSVGENREVTGWNLRTRKPQHKWELPAGDASSIALTPDGRYLARGMADGTLEVFRVAEKRAVV
jgi:WD40 repeat protein